MSEIFRCEDKDTLVAYLYGEAEPDVRREVERHLRTCGVCAREVDDLQGVRQDLQLWLPPEPALGFTIVQNPGAAAAAPASVLTSSRWAALQHLPTWAQVAAAALLVAAAAAIANVQVRSTSDGVVVTTGWMQPAPVALPAATPSNDEWRAALVALEADLRGELGRQVRSNLAASQTDARPSAAPGPAAHTAADTAVLRRVESMIAASEERQRQELALNFRRAEANWNVRRQADLASINQAFGSLQGRTIAVQAGQQELMNRFRLQRVSAPQPNQ